MRRIKLIIGGLIISLSALGQGQGKRVPLDEIINFSLPAGSEELAIEKRESAKKAGKKSEIDFKKMKGLFFKVNESLWVLTGGVGTMQSDFLKGHKGLFDDTYSRIPVENYSRSSRNLTTIKCWL